MQLELTCSLSHYLQNTTEWARATLDARAEMKAVLSAHEEFKRCAVSLAAA
jgi:hypothetical protein